MKRMSILNLTYMERQSKYQQSFDPIRTGFHYKAIYLTRLNAANLN